MIDVHTHILPEIDDGSKSMEISKELINQEINNQVNYVFLTPHQTSQKDNTQDIRNAFEKFNKEVTSNEIKFFLGAEILFDKSFFENLEKKKYLSINNSKYILIEFTCPITYKMSELMYEINIRGYIPIVAHVERYGLDFEDIIDIKEGGGLIQINSSILSLNKPFLNKLIKKNLIDFVASDCHDLKRNVDFVDIKKYIYKKNKILANKIFSDDFIYKINEN